MNYLPSDTAEKVFARLEALEKKIAHDDEWYKTLRKDVMKAVADLREEIISTGSKFEQEQLAIRLRRAKAIEQLKSE